MTMHPQVCDTYTDSLIRKRKNEIHALFMQSVYAKCAEQGVIESIGGLIAHGLLIGSKVRDIGLNATKIAANHLIDKGMTSIHDSECEQIKHDVGYCIQRSGIVIDCSYDSCL